MRRIKISMVEMIGVDFDPDTDFRGILGKLPLEFFRECLSRSNSRVEKFLPFTILEPRIPANSVLLLGSAQCLVIGIHQCSPHEYFRSGICRKLVSDGGVNHFDVDTDGF